MTSAKGATMTSAKKDDAAEPDVDLDLLAEDATLREAIGKPTRIRIPGGDEHPGGVAVTFPPQADWPHEATLLAARGVWGAWARSVLSDDDFGAWQRAHLKNYQIARIEAVISAASGISPGKQ